MKTNAKKRMLISSVAMLLVAMIALGTATFAWFTQNTQATANNLSAKTVKASELMVSSKNNDWTDTLNYNIDQTLKPVSTANGIDWFSAVAAKKDNSTVDKTTVNRLDATEHYAIVDQLNIQNQGGAAVKNVSINFSLKEMNSNDSITNFKYLRVALVPVTKAGYTPETADEKTAYADNFKSHVYASVVDTADAITGTVVTDNVITDLKTETVQTINASSTEFKVTLPSNLAAYGDKDGKDTAYFNLYVWFEGQDTDCKDANAGNKMPEITFNVTGDTVE